MLLVENFLSEEGLNLVDNKIEKFYRGETRGWTNLSWDPQLIKNSALIYIVDFSELNEMIYDRIIQLDDRFVNSHVSCQFCVWGPGSKINFHADAHKQYAATVYLNKEWDFVDGGLFQWVDKESGLLFTHPPLFNSCVINTDHELHHVTQIGYYVDKLRFTIQVWGTAMTENQENSELIYS